MEFERIQMMPQDIITHIGLFYVTKQIKLQWRLHKLYNKVEELEKRTIDEWIHHIKFSKWYETSIKINNDIVEYINMYGDKIKLHKNDLIHQGYIKHKRSLHLCYVQRIKSISIC